MDLTLIFRLHALLALPYALALLLVPQETIRFFSTDPLGLPGIDITRLFGAALLLIALMTWGASRLKDSAARRMVAQSLFIYTTVGLVSLLRSQLLGYWNTLGWVNILSYLIFVIGYGYFLCSAPRASGAEGIEV